MTLFAVSAFHISRVRGMGLRHAGHLIRDYAQNREEVPDERAANTPAKLELELALRSESHSHSSHRLTDVPPVRKP